MSAAAEYYGYLLQQGYGESQLKKFAQHASRANRGEISHNKAYKLALKDGFGQLDGNGWDNAEGDEVAGKRTFGDWVNTAQEAGWIDQGIGLIGGLIQNRRENRDGGMGTNQVFTPPPPPPPEGMSTGAKVGIGIGVVAVIGLIAFLVLRKK
jgi:hypothetical protein